MNFKHIMEQLIKYVPYKKAIALGITLTFGAALTIGAVINTTAEDKPNTLYAGVLTNQMEAEGQEIFIDTNKIRQVALDKYYYDKWLEEQKRQLEEIKRKQEEIRITTEGECKIIQIPTKSYTIMAALIEVVNPNFNANEAESELNPKTILQPLEYGVECFYKGLKTYMDYRTITATSSPQWILQHMTDDYNAQVDAINKSELSPEEKAIQTASIPKPDTYVYTDEQGFRRIHCQNPYDSEYIDRYMIAVGSGISTKIGRYVDLELSDGSTVPAVIGDQKSDAHTDTFSHLMTSVHNPLNCCASEYIVEQDKLSPAVIENGDCSYALNKVGVKVDSIKVYNKSI